MTLGTADSASPAALPDYADVLARYEAVIGLETHVELGTASKMFCGCSTEFGAPPNTQVCPVCLGLPGSLPVVNEAAVRFTVAIGLALHCEIAAWCRFARKNYFYPDMPKDFQISQYDEPLCVGGYLDVDVDGETHRVGITRVHMEEDTGKTMHVGSSTGRIHGADYSLVDYNRSGIPLVEIVTEPDIRSPEVARAYVRELRELLRTLGVSDVKMEQGSLRCDANVSLRPRGSSTFGTRTETKNVNSLRSVERAVRYEILRQSAVLDAARAVTQETRHFHENSGTTSSGRSKEEATDYRYFPEPDLVPLALPVEYVDEVRATLPETPAERRRRMVEQFGFTELELAQMTGADVLDLVQETISAGAPPAEARNWWMGELARRANDSGVEPRDLRITPRQVAEVAALVADGTLTTALARQVVDGVLAGEGEPAEVVERRGLRQVSDDAALLPAIDAALAAQPEIVAKVQGGKVAAIGPIVGAVMKSTKGQANAAKVRELVLTRIGVSG